MCFEDTLVEEMHFSFNQKYLLSKKQLSDYELIIFFISFSEFLNSVPLSVKNLYGTSVLVILSPAFFIYLHVGQQPEIVV